MRFRQAERAQDFAGCQASQIFFLLVVAAEGQQRDLNRGIGHAQRRSHGRVHARDLFEHQHVGNSIEARAAPLFRDEHPATADLSQFLDLFSRKAPFAVALPHRRPHLIFHELPDGIASQFLVVVERKIHRV